MPSRRPGSVTAAGVMAIIYGSLFAVCGLCGVVVMAARGNMGNDFFAGNDPAAAQLQKQMEAAVQEALERDAPGYQAFQVVGAIVSLGAALGLLIAGIGLLGMRRWARTLAIAGCLIAIANTIVHAGYQIAYVIPITSHVIEVELPPALPQGGGPQADQLKLVQMMQTMVGAMLIGLNVVFVIYLFVIIFLLRRRHVLTAFAAQEIGDSADQPISEERRWGDDEDDRDWNQPK